MSDLKKRIQEAMEAIFRDALAAAQTRYEVDISRLSSKDVDELCAAHEALVGKCTARYRDSEIPPELWDILTLAPQRREWLTYAICSVDWSNTPKNATVVDWGSGTGVIPRILQHMDVDCNLIAVEPITTWAEYIKVEVSGCHVENSNIESFCRHEPVDVIFSFLVHHHIEDFAAVLAKASSVLNADGDFIIVDKIETSNYDEASAVLSEWEVDMCDGRSVLPPSIPPHPIASSTWNEYLRPLASIPTSLSKYHLRVINAVYLSDKVVLLHVKSV